MNSPRQENDDVITSKDLTLCLTPIITGMYAGYTHGKGIDNTGIEILVIMAGIIPLGVNSARSYNKNKDPDDNNPGITITLGAISGSAVASIETAIGYALGYTVGSFK